MNNPVKNLIRSWLVCAGMVLCGTVALADQATDLSALAQARLQAQLCLAEARRFLDDGQLLAAIERCQRIEAIQVNFPQDSSVQNLAEDAAMLKASALRMSQEPAPPATRTSNSASDTPARDPRQELLAQIQEDMVPQVELLRKPSSYPSTQKDIQSQGSFAAKVLKDMAPWETRIHEALKVPIQVEFTNTPFEQVLDFLRDASGVNIVVDRSVFQEARPLTLKLANPVRLRSALDWIMEIEGLQYRIRDEAIFISRSETFDREFVLRTYDISDLLFNLGDLPPVELAYDGKAFSVKNTADTISLPGGADPRSEETGRRWVEWITQTVAPHSWQSEGDARAQGVIDYRAGKLVVTHTESVHQQIQELLNRFREARAAIVSIQARFLEVRQEFLEKIGFDWAGLEASFEGLPDTTVQGFAYTDNTTLTSISPGAGFASDPADPVLISPGPPPVFFNYRPVRAATRNVISIAPESPLTLTDTGGLFLRFSLLKNQQLSGLLDALQKTGQGTVLNAPRVTCYNTQRAYMTVANLVTYVRRVSADQNPEVATVVDGIILEVQPFVSADRRFVTIELRPAINSLVRTAAGEIEQFVWKLEGALYPNVVQVPRIRRQGLNTTVSVPDGGTLMIGGFANSVKREGRSSIPVLGQLPLVNFFFRRDYASDATDTIVVLLTANILLQED